MVDLKGVKSKEEQAPRPRGVAPQFLKLTICKAKLPESRKRTALPAFTEKKLTPNPDSPQEKANASPMKEGTKRKKNVGVCVLLGCYGRERMRGNENRVIWEKGRGDLV